MRIARTRPTLEGHAPASDPNLPAIATGVALATALALITPRAAGDQRDEIDALAIVLCVITGLAIGFRREYPLGQYVVAMAAVLTYAARDYPGGPIYLVAFGSALAMVAGTERRTWMPAAFIGGALLIAVQTAVYGWETHFLIFGAIWVVGSVLFGEAARLRREQARTTEARAEFTQRSREQEARRRLAEERLQIARDVHDVVGHSLATIALQAGVAEHLLDGREEKARESMAAIRRLSREALGEVSAMLGVLRSDDGAERAPAPDLDQVSRLVEDVRAAGLSVELELDGRHVPEVVGGAAYRIVQESLTNVVRHAGPDASARVRVTNAARRPRGRDHRRRRRRRARRAGRQRADRHARARHGARRQLRGRRRARRRLPRPRDAPGAMTRVVLVDDQALVRGGLRALLEAEDDLEVVGEAADGAAAIDTVARTRPDVVLMDIRMPGVDGLEATRRIAADPALSDVKVLMLTTFEVDEYVFEALRVGASGFLLKDEEPVELLRAVRVVAAGESLLSPSVTRRVVETFAAAHAPQAPALEGLSELTEREREIVALVGTGLSNHEIAEQLVISPATARTHVSRAMLKLGVRDRAQLVVFAYEAGLVAPGQGVRRDT